ncbi:MAG: acyl-CoA dehydratase activase-related protein, partial [Spirochaetota bacterium]
VQEFAEAAFTARRIPRFNFGCAVFLEADIVTFQQLGWQPEEIMAGLALVLPQNVWHYVVREPNLGRLGRVYVLQGGTHRNLAVVKTQQDFITARVPDARIHLHPYGEVAGAIGAALEARKNADGTVREVQDGFAPFVGFEDLDQVRHRVQRDERTRCTLCGNRCQRTFIHVEHGARRYLHILAGCERGQDPRTAASPVHSGGRHRHTHADPRPARGGPRGSTPRRGVNFAALSNRRLFSVPETHPLTGATARLPLQGATVGIPRVLNLYSTAPFFSAFFAHLGARVVFSGPTTLEWFARTSGRGCIDPCFPTKAALSHVYQLLCMGDVTHLFFPCIRSLRPDMHAELHWSCAALAAAPEAVKAALTMGTDEFASRGAVYLDPVLDMAEWDLLERQLHRSLRRLGVSRGRVREAVEAGLRHWDRVTGSLREQAGRELERLERERGIGILLLGRPYHLDPGVNHGIPEELSARGYSVFTTGVLPREGELVRRLFRPERDRGAHPLDIGDLWPGSFSENSSIKLWAGRFAARHPNLIAVEISSFRCGHDAPLYSVLDELFAASGKPYFTFHEMDENRPAGTIRLRVETIDYFLRQYREDALPCPRSCLVV